MLNKAIRHVLQKISAIERSSKITLYLPSNSIKFYKIIAQHLITSTKQKQVRATQQRSNSLENAIHLTNFIPLSPISAFRDAWLWELSGTVRDQACVAKPTMHSTSGLLTTLSPISRGGSNNHTSVTLYSALLISLLWR